MTKKIFMFTILILLLPFAYSKQGHLKLLAVKEQNGGQIGSGADLYLEIIQGSGRVFLETFPLTKVDTQMSTRFAKEIACKYVDLNCDNHDFIYTIKADSAIIGGPSAGAAVAVLTIGVLKNLNLDEDMSISGAINAGGIIGPIGGLKEKIEAGSNIGLKKILIPKGQRFFKLPGNNSENNTISNTTLDLVNLGREIGVEVVEVSDLGSAVYEFTGKDIEENNLNLSIDNSYIDIMKGLAVDLCQRGVDIKKEIELSYTNIELNESDDLLNKARDSFYAGNFYSSASYCFSANTKLRFILLQLKNLSKKDILFEAEKTRKDIESLNKNIEARQIETITDLEAYMVTNERILEANDYLDNAILVINETTLSLSNLAFSIERLYSANSWSSFFKNYGKEFVFNKDILRNSCQNKLSEAQERIQYANFYYPTSLKKTQSNIDEAFEYFNKENYILCLFTASKAKAEADILLSALGVDEDMVSSVIEQNLEAVKKSIIKQTKHNIFPILSYSYYEYANSLKESDPYSAILFSEYSLEISNLDLYFKEKERVYFHNLDFKILIAFAIGVIVGIIIKRPWKKKINVRSSKRRS